MKRNLAVPVVLLLGLVVTLVIRSGGRTQEFCTLTHPTSTEELKPLLDPPIEGRRPYSSIPPIEVNNHFSAWLTAFRVDPSGRRSPLSNPTTLLLTSVGPEQKEANVTPGPFEPASCRVPLADGQWHGFLPVRPWLVYTAWDDRTSYRVTCATLCPERPSAEALLMPIAHWTFNGIDSFTGTALLSGVLMFLPVPNEPSLRRSILGAYDSSPPEDAVVLANMKFPMLLDDLPGSGVFWMGASGYAWKAFDFDPFVRSTVLHLDPVGSLSIVLDSSFHNEIWDVQLQPLGGTRESDALRSWRPVSALMNVHYDGLPAGTYQVRLRHGRGTGVEWQQVVINRDTLVEVTLSRDRRVPPCGTLRATVVLPPELNRRDWTASLCSTRDGKLRAVHHEAVLSWAEEIPGVVYVNTFGGLEDGPYVIRITPSGASCSVVVNSRGTAEALLDLSDLLKVSILVHSEVTDRAVIIDWGYCTEGVQLKCSEAGLNGQKVSFLCARREIWIQGFVEGAASDRVLLAPSQEKEIDVELILRRERAVEVEMALWKADGAVLADDGVVERIQIEPIGHNGKYVYGKRSALTGNGVGRSHAYTLFMTERGVYSLTLWERPLGTPDNVVLYRSVVDLRNGNANVDIAL